jgi:hypothetical protein
MFGEQAFLESAMVTYWISRSPIPSIEELDADKTLASLADRVSGVLPDPEKKEEVQ